MKRVYLSGPITGLNYGECSEWRKQAIEEFRKYGITGVSPMRFKEHLDDGSILGDADENPLTTEPALITRDRFDVASCDVLFVNFLGARDVSIGSLFELAWADAYRKPIVTVMEREGNVHDHKFVREVTGFRAEDLKRGLEITRAIMSY